MLSENLMEEPYLPDVVLRIVGCQGGPELVLVTPQCLIVVMALLGDFSEDGSGASLYSLLVVVFGAHHY